MANILFDSDLAGMMYANPDDDEPTIFDYGKFIEDDEAIRDELRNMFDGHVVVRGYSCDGPYNGLIGYPKTGWMFFKDIDKAFDGMSTDHYGNFMWDCWKVWLDDDGVLHIEGGHHDGHDSYTVYGTTPRFDALFDPEEMDMYDDPRPIRLAFFDAEPVKGDVMVELSGKQFAVPEYLTTPKPSWMSGSS